MELLGDKGKFSKSCKANKREAKGTGSGWDSKSDTSLRCSPLEIEPLLLENESFLSFSLVLDFDLLLSSFLLSEAVPAGITGRREGEGKGKGEDKEGDDDCANFWLTSVRAVDFCDWKAFVI